MSQKNTSRQNAEKVSSVLLTCLCLSGIGIGPVRVSALPTWTCRPSLFLGLPSLHLPPLWTGPAVRYSASEQAERSAAQTDCLGLSPAAGWGAAGQNHQREPAGTRWHGGQASGRSLRGPRKEKLKSITLLKPSWWNESKFTYSTFYILVVKYTTNSKPSYTCGEIHRHRSSKTRLTQNWIISEYFWIKELELGR